jgi:hypothetical protein
LLAYFIRQTELTDLHSALFENAPQLAANLVLTDRRRTGKPEHQQALLMSTHLGELMALKGTV